MPSIYVYTPLISDLVPGKFVAVNENVKANSIMIEQASTGHMLPGHAAIIMY